MNVKLDLLQGFFEQGGVAGVFENVEIEELLDDRDEEPFDSVWITVHKRLESLSLQSPISSEDQNQLDRTRERAYRAVYDLTENPDASACVSDDFGLIGLSLLHGDDDSWVNALWLAYKEGVFPRGEISPVSGSLLALLG